MNSRDLGEAALALAEAGYAVLPLHTPENGACSCGKPACKSPGKHPRTKNGVKDATSDPTKIQAMWRKWPGANIGIATGTPSGVVVVDLDGPEAEAWLAGQENLQGSLPPTLQVKTARGRHIYFLMPHGAASIPTRAGIASKVDTRGDGGYVVAPPSLHPSNVRYEWCAAEDCAELPAWLLPLMFGRPIGAAPAGMAARGHADGLNLAGYGPPPPYSIETENELRSALACISSDDYGTWLQGVSALHWLSGGDGWAQKARVLADNWARTSEKFDEAEQDKLWRSLKGRPDGKATTIRTIFKLAQDAGWTAPQLQQTAEGLPQPLASASQNGPLPRLVINKADRPATVRALGALLSKAEGLFDRGGVPVMVVQPADGGAPKAVRLTYNNVIVQAHKCCRPVAVGEDGKRKPVTLPDAVAKMYLDLGEYGLRPLHGISTAPILWEDGSIFCRTGYLENSGLLCVATPGLDIPDRPTTADAKAALHRLRVAFSTFPFADAEMIARDGANVVDLSKSPSLAESSFLAALLTAVCRPSLDAAPGLLLTAPEISGAGCGKGLLVKAISQIAYGIAPAAFTAGHDRQEMDKRLVAELIESSPIVYFDNVNSTALKSNTLASVITEKPARVRVMGLSQMVPLNCTAFIAVTGNGLSVSEDLARRFIAVDLDAKCEDPEARSFPEGFIANIRQRRVELLRDALTIWRWGRQNNGDLATGLALGSFETWSRWVRDPLLTLGCRDPVERSRAAKANDPKRATISALFSAWVQHHGDHPVTAAELLPVVVAALDPQGRGRQYVSARLRQLAGTRAGGFVLTYQPPAGRWGAATYAVRQTDEAGATQAINGAAMPMGPMHPMPDAGHSPRIFASGSAELGKGKPGPFSPQHRHRVI